MYDETAPCASVIPAESLADVNPHHAEALVSASQLGQSDPMRAAELAERIFPVLRPEASIAPWLAFVIAISGRIHSLSSFEAYSYFIEFYAKHRSLLKTTDSLSQRVDVAYFGALVFHDIAHPDIARMADFALDVSQSSNDTVTQLEAANYLLLYRIWTGNLLGADLLRQQMLPLRERCTDVRTRLLSHSMSAMSLRLFLNYPDCLQEIDGGLQLAKRHKVHFWDSHLYMQRAFLALSRENLDEAQQWLDKMLAASHPEAYLDRSGFHYLCAWRYTIQGEKALALVQAQESTRLAERSGARFPIAVTHMGLAQVYLDQGLRGRALKQMVRARRMIRHMPGNAAIAFARGLAQANLCFKFDMRRRGARVLARALEIGHRERYLNFPWWRSEQMAPLCARALEYGIERDYVLWMIQKRRLRPPAGVRDWYWPLKATVLGIPRFCIDGELLALGARAQDLLTALAVWGGRGEYVDRARLIDHLWPQSEGDRAERALDTAVHRLRSQLGSEASILTQPGALALNPELCQVDYWDLLNRLDTPTPEDTQFLIDAIRTTAQLPSPVNELLPQTQLRRRMLQCVLKKLADSDDDGAQEQLETLVESMPESEKAWRALIQCYVRQELPSAAVDAWRRARDALQKYHGVEPSSVTRELVAPWLN